MLSRDDRDVAFDVTLTAYQIDFGCKLLGQLSGVSFGYASSKPLLSIEFGGVRDGDLI